jgi:hypothetical protein
MGSRPSLDDYVDVAERIQDFKDAHPKGVLRRVGYEVLTIDGRAFIVYTARAYPDPIGEPDNYADGTSWEPFPGRTPYTKDSELMNAETAAWGRAIVALGLVANRSLASRQEVRNRQADLEADAAEAPKAKAPAKSKAQKPAPPSGASAEVLGRIRELVKAAEWTPDKLAWTLVELGVDADASTLKEAMAGISLDVAIQLAEKLGGTLDGLAGV